MENNPEMDLYVGQEARQSRLLSAFYWLILENYSREMREEALSAVTSESYRLLLEDIVCSQCIFTLRRLRVCAITLTCVFGS